jgi:CheY-like chemotaxis protein
LGESRTRLVYIITDDGIGLSPDEIGRLFAPFAQASAETARQFGGAGLGLAFARNVARAMGGDLTVDSTHNRGSTFRLDVVVAPARSTTSIPSLGSHDAANIAIAPLRILCAEDNPYGRVVMNTIAHALGHSVDFVGDGAAAVSAVGADKHDIVLMDLTLPGLDGIEATRRIRALPGKTGTIPVIGVSGHTEADDAQAARTAGMDDYLAKPVSPAALAQAIAGVAERLKRA